MAGSYSGVQRPSKQSTFVALMLVSAVLVLLPGDLLRPLRNLAQLTAPFQWLTAETTRSATQPFRELGTPVIDAEKYAELMRHIESLRNQNASLALHTIELQARISELTHIRQAGFPEHGRLIPARVIAADALASRGSLLLSKGRAANVKIGDWVTSRRFVNAGSEDGVRPGASVLSRESLIGWVEETEAFVSRVVLLSDAIAGRVIAVHIERHDPQHNRPLVAILDGKPAKFALEGAGQGLMKIPEIDARWVDKKLIQVGDTVMSDPNDARLPVAMAIGEITALERVRDDKKKPLYYTAYVKHRYDPELLGQVFVADFTREASSPATED